MMIKIIISQDVDDLSRSQLAILKQELTSKLEDFLRHVNKTARINIDFYRGDTIIHLNRYEK